MKTAEALEGMTDAGEFEVLATRVLRLEEEDCRLLEHMGVNAAGKTIANPIDGFCLLPGSNPPRFVMAAFTTSAATSLRRKWLFGHERAPSARFATTADDGDLVKAGRRAASLRKDHPTAQFVVYLCTNRQPDDQLMSEAYLFASKSQVEVRFLCRSRLRDCLDTTRDGQWLRKEHLGIEAELLSLPLLLDLAQKNLEKYGKEFILTPPQDFVPSSFQRVLQESLDSPARAVHILSGTSGSGKSVTSYQVLHKHLLRGEIGLWIRGEVAAREASLEEAIEATLRSLHPTIERGSGSVALGFASPERPFLVVVDDVNRHPSPLSTIRKVLAWAAPAEKRSKDKNTHPPIAIVIPVWDLFWAPFRNLYHRSPWLSDIMVGRMKENDALRCLETGMRHYIQQLSPVARRELVATLGYDAILIGMFCSLCRTQPTGDVMAMRREIMEHFVQEALADIAASAGYLVAELSEALHALAENLLLKHEFYPEWSDVRQWLPDRQTQLVRQLAAQGRLCRVTGVAGEQRFEFRHDRILEYYLVEAIKPMLIQPDKHADIVTDPFYVQYVGRALSSGPVQDDSLEWLTHHAPVSLITAIRSAETGSVAAVRIAEAAKKWLSHAAQDRRTPPSMLYESYRLLTEIDSPLVIEVTDSLRSHRLLARARLANGDANSGVIEFSDRRWFAPAVTDHGLDSILDRALHRYREKLVRECSLLLGKPHLKESQRIGALTLAGFIGDTELSGPIREAWNAAMDKPSVLMPAIWAASRCGGDEPAAILEPMMTVWASFSDERPQHGLSDRAAIAENLRFAMRRGIPDAVLEYLVTFAKENEALRWHIVWLLNHVDHPIAVQFLLEEAAAVEQKEKESDGISPWLHMLHDEWDPTMKRRGHRLSPAALAVVRACWEDAAIDERVKETAFRFWVRAVDDVTVLQSIPQDRPGFSQALWRRAHLGDQAAIPFVKPLLADNRRWFHVLHHIWSEVFVEVTDNALLALRDHTPSDHSGGYTDEHYMLARLLRDIPLKDAEPLLTKHWDHLKYSRLFVQAALYLGTSKTLALAATAIGQYPRETDVFEHASSFFGFHMEGLSDRISIAHLEVLRPYLGQLDCRLLSDMAEFCERHDHREWSEKYLRPECERRRAAGEPMNAKAQTDIDRMVRHHFPSDGNLTEELDQIEQQSEHHGRLWHWCKEFERRHDKPERWSRILDQWLAASSTTKRLRLVADALLQRGSRQDLQVLTKYPIEGDKDSAAVIVEDARFGVMRRSLN